jgi:hypothetical protein
VEVSERGLDQPYKKVSHSVGIHKKRAAGVDAGFNVDTVNPSEATVHDSPPGAKPLVGYPVQKRRKDHILLVVVKYYHCDCPPIFLIHQAMASGSSAVMAQDESGGQ